MARYELNLDKLKEAIDIAGGVGDLSVKTKVSYQSIIDWRSGKKSPSVESCIKIEEATDKKIRRKDLLPTYPWGEPQANVIKEEKLEIAKNLLAMGMDKAAIAKATGLSVEELDGIKN